MNLQKQKEWKIENQGKIKIILHCIILYYIVLYFRFTQAKKITFDKNQAFILNDYEQKKDNQNKSLTRVVIRKLIN